METVSPNIYVNDLQATIDFYSNLGFKVITTVPPEGEPIFALMMNGGVTFMFQTFASLGDTLPEIPLQTGAPILLYVNMKGVRKFHDEIKDKVSIHRGLEVTFYGATEFSVLDNNGILLTFAEDE